MHAPQVAKLDLAAVRRLAVQTPYATDFDYALQMLNDESIHQMTEMDTTLAVASELRSEQIDTLYAAGQIRPIREESVKGWGNAYLVGEPMKLRQRPIIDMLTANVLLQDAPKVQFADLQQWTEQACQHRVAGSIDMKGWYFQIPVSEEVQPYLCIKTSRGWYAMTHAPMGHKWSVFIAHTITKILAHDENQKLFTDIIIDNVFVAGENTAEVNEYIARFYRRCASANVTIGDVTVATKKVEHRGVLVSLNQKTVC